MMCDFQTWICPICCDDHAMDRPCKPTIQADIEDRIEIDAGGQKVTVFACDVVEHIRNENSDRSMPLAGKVLPDGTVFLRDDVLDNLK